MPIRNSEFRVELTTNWSDLPVTRMEWDDLLARCNGVTVFQTYEWYASWWAAFGRQHRLLLLTARESDRLVGIAPMMVVNPRSSRSRVTFIGGENADYQDFLIATDTKQPVLEGFLESVIDSERFSETLELRNVPVASNHLHKLGALASTIGLHPMFRSTLCPTLLLEDHEDAVRAILKKPSVRRPLNYFRRCGDVQWRTFTREDEALKHLPLFATQHTERWRGTNNPSRLQETDYVRFYQELIRNLLPRGWLSFSTLELDGEPIAFHFGFLYRGRLYWYKPSFSMVHAKHSPGTLLIRYLIEYALNTGIEELDFTIGNEPFKDRFTNAERSNFDVILYRQRAPYLAATFHRGLRSAARHLLHVPSKIRVATAPLLSRAFP